jgi:hypothetical protein
MHTPGLTKTLPMAASALLVAVSTACAQMAPPEDEEAARAAALITAENLEMQLGVIAHDSMRGRDTPSPELMETALYIADQFRSFGLEPGAGSDYVQLYPMTRTRPAGAAQQKLRFSGPAGTTDLVYGDGFFVQATAPVTEAEGPVVLVESAADMPAASGQIAILRVTTANIRQVFGGRLRDAVRAARPVGLVVVLDVPDAQFERFRGFLGSERVVYGVVESDGIPVAFVAQRSLPEGLAAHVAGGAS